MGIAVDTVPALLAERARLTPGATALHTLEADGNWLAQRWRDFATTVWRVARGLRAAGTAPGEVVGILAPTGRDWEYAHLGILAARGVAVGLDPHDRTDNLSDIIRRSGMRSVFVGAPASFRALDADVRDGLARVIDLGGGEPVPGATTFAALLEAGDHGPTGAVLEAEPDDPATLVFTSGTTGRPKGIAYRHCQVMQAVAAILETFDDVEEGSRLVCWLPLSNLFQRILNLCAVGQGAQTYFVGNPAEVMDHLRTINPRLFIAVPRFFEKVNEGVERKVAAGGMLSRRLAGWSVAVGDRVARAGREGRRASAGDRLAHALAERLVLRRVRGIFGDNLKYLVSGSAPMPVWLLERMHAYGLLVLEAYGISENIVPVAANTARAHRFGTVGRPLARNTIRLAEDGELLVRGEGVFQGYLGEGPEDRLTRDGFLRTGDLVELDDDGFIRIRGRKSEIFKTSTGRRLSPVPIEECLKRAAGVEAAAAFGANRKQPVAVVCVRAQVSSAAGADTARRLRDVVASVQAACRDSVAELPAYQRPAGLVLTPRLFSIEAGELTSNLKLRRHAIEAGYSRSLARLDRLLRENQTAAGGIAYVEQEEAMVVVA